MTTYIKMSAAVVSLVALSMAARGGVLLSENFNDITTLAGSGWVLTNNSNPLGLTGWFQGNTGVFSSQGGAANAYIAANFDNAAFGGDISNWLITPVLTLDSSTVFSFYTRTEPNPPAADDLQVWMSANGSSSNTGTTSTSTGDFSTLLLDVNPTLDVNGYPQAWTQYTISLASIALPVTGRLAFRYVVPDTSVNADYIGIDTVLDTSNLPEPYTMGLSLVGLGAIFAGRRFKRATVLASLVACSLLPAGKAQTASKEAGAPSAAKTIAVPVSAGGLVIFIDPVTHQIRQPDASEIAALIGQTSTVQAHSIAAEEVIRGPGNAVGLRLNSDSMVNMIVTRTPDGKLKQECVTGDHAAAARVSAVQTPAKKETPDVK